MPDISEILKRAKPREKSVFMCLAGDVIAEIDRLERELAGLSDTWTPDSLASSNPGEKITTKIKALREQMKAAETEFRFRAIGARAWSDLVAAHPSKNPNEGWDPETFPRALVSVCCVDPVMTPEQVDALFEVLNEGQRSDLMQAAYDVNAEATSIPFSVSASAIFSSLTDGK
ncbi:hypothetical protein KQY30_20150 [Streptomyces sp. GMY02]|uniref:hypothetical protein n=1 Tax=Streptomyces sp. GMY02 TaxID=1333528 RepID=UPI001C2CAD1F|nr:hypothetical protein [Streptomyces sp. GMY02]QXE36211.1 hypothetical protein KQY30_20150 [Streptomyces sp. GMY02]